MRDFVYSFYVFDAKVMQGERNKSNLFEPIAEPQLTLCKGNASNAEHQVWVNFI